MYIIHIGVLVCQVVKKKTVELTVFFLTAVCCFVYFVYFILANRSTAFVKLSMVFSESPFSIPSRTQCLICPSNTTCPHLCRADFAALICDRISSQGTSSSIMRSMACTWPMIFAKRRCRFSESMHCFISVTSLLWSLSIIHQNADAVKWIRGSSSRGSPRSFPPAQQHSR